MTYPAPQLNDTDLELLSAYIDGQVSAAERTALEARLEREPDLRQALAELRTTVAMVRELPALRPPHSFTIDPATVQPRGFGLALGLRLGSALAALLLAFTFTLRMGDVGSSASAPAAQQPVLVAAPTDAPASEAARAAATEAMAAPAAAALATVAPAAPAAPAAPELPAAAAATAAPAAAAGEAPAGAQTTGSEVPAQPAPGPPGVGAAGSTNDQSDSATTKQATPAPTATADVVAQAPLPPATVLIEPPQNSSPGTTVLEQPEDAPIPAAQATQPGFSLVQLGLLVLALMLLVASFVVTRR